MNPASARAEPAVGRPCDRPALISTSARLCNGILRPWKRILLLTSSKQLFTAIPPARTDDSAVFTRKNSFQGSNTSLCDILPRKATDGWRRASLLTVIKKPASKSRVGFSDHIPASPDAGLCAQDRAMSHSRTGGRVNACNRTKQREK